MKTYYILYRFPHSPKLYVMHREDQVLYAVDDEGVHALTLVAQGLKDENIISSYEIVCTS